MKLLVLACFVGLVVAEVPLVAEAPLELAKPLGDDVAKTLVAEVPLAAEAPLELAKPLGDDVAKTLVAEVPLVAEAPLAMAKPSGEDVAKTLGDDVAKTMGRPPIVLDYHAEIGIPEAARIKAAEEAMDFSGVRIVGGSAASLGQYPHMAGLVITMSTGQTSSCGSTLISNTRIVTAAHCWRSWGFQATRFEVVLGSTLLFSGGTRIPTSNVVIHPNYNQWDLHNDIAVGVISRVEFNDVIRAIPLASGSDTFVGVWAWAAGFGIQRDGGGISDNQSLHHVSMQVITNNVCWNTYWNTVISSTLCVATTGGRSVCGGDSGGPLEATVGGVRTLIGVTSFGHASGCERNFPAGFARVSSFNAWLNSQM